MYEWCNKAWARHELGIGSHIVLVSGSHSIRHARTVGLLWARDRPVAENATHNKHKRRILMPWTWFEPAIPAIERLQTYSFDRSATESVKFTFTFPCTSTLNSRKVFFVLDMRVSQRGSACSFLPSFHPSFHPSFLPSILPSWGTTDISNCSAGNNSYGLEAWEEVAVVKFR